MDITKWDDKTVTLKVKKYGSLECGKATFVRYIFSGMEGVDTGCNFVWGSRFK